MTGGFRAVMHTEASCCVCAFEDVRVARNGCPDLSRGLSGRLSLMVGSDGAVVRHSSLLAVPLPHLRQLPRVIYVVPDAVETAGQGCDRREEGVAHPDGKYRVLLSA